MAIRDPKMVRHGGTASKVAHFSLAPAINLAAAVIRVLQIPYSFTVDNVQAWCRVLAGNVSVLVGIVRPGKPIGAVTLGIAATVQRFKITAAFIGVNPNRAALSQNQPLTIATVFNQAILDNILFSAVQTINAAAVAGQFWGAWRIQRDPVTGAISTKARSTDQNYATEAVAIVACPAPDPGFFDLGTITIRSAAGATFTTTVTALNAGGTTVNYNGTPAGFVNVCTANPAYVSANVIRASMVAAQKTRSVGGMGGLIVVQATTDGAGALTDGTLDVTYRPWPLNGEATMEGT